MALLAPVADGGAPEFVDRLPRGERAHDRKNTRKYAAIGELRVEVATTTAEARSRAAADAELTLVTAQFAARAGRFVARSVRMVGR